MRSSELLIPPDGRGHQGSLLAAGRSVLPPVAGDCSPAWDAARRARLPGGARRRKGSSATRSWSAGAPRRRWPSSEARSSATAAAAGAASSADDAGPAVGERVDAELLLLPDKGGHAGEWLREGVSSVSCSNGSSARLSEPDAALREGARGGAFARQTEEERRRAEEEGPCSTARSSGTSGPAGQLSAVSDLAG